MEQYIFDSNNGLWYELDGDYYIPCLTPPEKEQAPIGIRGKRHADYLKAHHKTLYTSLLTSGTMHTHLAEVDRQAHSTFELLMKQMAQAQGITETLKERDQFAWVRAMNNIRNAAEEIVCDMFLYSL